MASNTQFASQLRRVIPLSLTLALLANCDATIPPKATSQEHLVALSEKTANDSYRNATAPLDDFSLRADAIPPILQKAAKNPYAPLPKVSCSAVKLELAQLDAVLGQDMQAATTQKHSADDFSLENVTSSIDAESIFARGENFAHDTVVGFVKSQTVITPIQPFRSVIRQLSGATKHEKEVAHAQEAGKLRRAYLKGVLQTTRYNRCPTPALPPAPAIEEASLIPWL